MWSVKSVTQLQASAWLDHSRRMPVRKYVLVSIWRATRKPKGHAFRNRAGAVTDASGAQERHSAVHMSGTACGTQTCVDGTARTRRRALLSNKRCRSGAAKARPTQDPAAEAAHTCSSAALRRTGTCSIVEIYMCKVLILPCGRAQKHGKLQPTKYRHQDV